MAEERTAWNVEGALAKLRDRIDPYIWDQGQELYRRRAVEDFEIIDAANVRVRVLEPREGRSFPVALRREGAAIEARCPCPLRVGGYCRHQVVALEYLRAAARGEAAAVPSGSSASTAAPGAGGQGPPAPAADQRPLLYRLFRAAHAVSTRPDGSLLRVCLHRLGSSRAPHLAALQLWTGTGWTEMRSGGLERWIRRGEHPPHPRDAALAAAFGGGAASPGELDSDALARLLALAAGSEALATRTGQTLPVSAWPWVLSARVTRSGDGPALRIGLYCSAPDGASRAFQDVALVPAATPWIQLGDGSFHPLVAGAAGAELDLLQEEDFSEVPIEELERFLAEGIEALERLCPGGVEMEPGLVRSIEGVDGARLRLAGEPTRLHGALELSYDGQWAAAPPTPAPWTIERDGEIIRFPPAGHSLARAARELTALGFLKRGGEWVLEARDALARALEPRPQAFVELHLPRSLDRLQLAKHPPLLELSVRAADGAAGGVGSRAAAPAGRPAGFKIDWFEVRFRLLDGERELPVDLRSLLDVRAARPRGLHQLEDGTVLDLDADAIATLCRLAGAAGGPIDAGVGLRLTLAAVSELLGESPSRRVAFEGRALELAESLQAAPGAPEPDLEPRLREFLRPYQRQALRWFGELRRWGLGGILADEMGLGKTVMALAHLLGRRDGGGDGGPPAPILVVCPASLVFNWLDEIRRHFPDARALGLAGLQPEERRAALRSGADVLVTSYGLLRRDRELFEGASFRAAILDEAQHIKNADSQTAAACFGLAARERWALTGTPVENHLGELWSILQFVLPGYLGERRAFQRSAGGESGLDALRARIRPFVLRRTRKQVLQELPPRIDQVRRAPMTLAQRRLYETALSRARSELGPSDRDDNRFRVLAALTRLRQISCHPGLVDDEARHRSAAGADEEALELAGGKFALLVELLEECIAEGHRVLLFSQFTSMLDLIEERLDVLGIARSRLDGSTRDRERAVREFQDDDSIPVFLISLKAGGYGLNLTAADTVILYDPWWNPAVEEQAASRAYRLGQSRTVHVHRLIAADSVEEKMLELQDKKRDLAARLVGSEDEAMAALSFEDLKRVLME
jgi:superfamily II DNA or RNA helicase